MLKSNKYRQICYIKGISTILISGLIFLSCISVFFLPMIATVEIGNLKSGILVTVFLLSVALIGIFGIYKGYDSIKSTYPIKNFICEPQTIVSQIIDQKISRLKFLWATFFNPKSMQLSTLYAIWISLCFLTLYFFADKTTRIADKLIFLLLLMLVHFVSKIAVFIQYNRLYNQMGNIITAIDKSGVYWLFFDEEILENSEDDNFFDNDEVVDNVVAFTPWEQIRAINYYKDYVVLHCEERDYIFFVNNNKEKAIINTYFAQQNMLNLYGKNN